MSAWFCTPECIIDVVHAIRRKTFRPESEAEIELLILGDVDLGRKLYETNIRSLDARYGRRRGETVSYRNALARFAMNAPAPCPWQILKSLDCYLYQSCEHDTSKDPVFLFVQRVREDLCDELTHTTKAERERRFEADLMWFGSAFPAYERAEWMRGMG